MKKYILIVLTILMQTSYSQVKIDYIKERNDFNLSLIKKGKQGLNTKKLNSNEKYLGNFLGVITTNNNEVLYIVTNSHVFNLKNSPTAESHIFIYNNKKQFIGYYYLSYINELPKKLEKGKLYFKNKDCKEENIIDFKNGIPRVINLKCNDENNYYEFQK